ncbi:reverse transcriptase domain-containing protein [Tanacetum coccineum]
MAVESAACPAKIRTISTINPPWLYLKNLLTGRPMDSPHYSKNGKLLKQIGAIHGTSNLIYRNSKMAGLTEGGGPEGQDDREANPPPLTKEEIEGHLSVLKSIIQDHNRRNKANPVRLDFELEDTKVRDNRIVKGKEVVDDDLKKPFKEALKTPLTHRIIEFAGLEYKMPTNIKLYDETTDSEDRLSRFASAANSGEWPMRVWCRMFQQTLNGSTREWFKHLPSNNIIEWSDLRERSLPGSRERWTVEMGFIMGIPEVMKISSFMDSVKSPELAKHFSNKVHVAEKENTIANHPSWRFEGTDLRRNDNRSNYRGRDTFVPHRGRDYIALYPPPNGDHNNRVVSVLTLDALTKHPKEILATKTQLRLPAPWPMLNPRERTSRNGCSPTGKNNQYDQGQSSSRQEANGSGNNKAWINIPITFPSISSEDVSNEPLIAEAEVEGYLVRRVYVDEGSSMEVMFEHCFDNLNPGIKSRLKETQTDLVGFAGEISKSLGKIELEAILSTIHSIMKFPTSKGVVRLVTQTVIIIECRCLEKKQVFKEEVSKGEKEISMTEEVLANPAFSDQLVTIKGGFSKTCSDQLKSLLKNNMEIFAWEPADMIGVPRRIIEHTLNVNPSIELVCQKIKTFAPETSKVVTKDVAKWVKSGIVRPVKYPTWISNPVLVKKCDGTWRMCIDFKNLNSACPKDYYPLSNIDYKVESVMGFKYKCFLDAYNGYHQIQMAREDEEKTAFYTEQGTYCYTKMPFGLKNIGATYQRDKKMLLADVAETFDNLRKINMKLNPKKCSFLVEEGKFLGYMVTSKGIRANPKKTKALADLQSPQTLKEMQSLGRKLAALNSERNYAPMEKLALSLFHMTRRLRRYFEAHPTKVITDQPIKQILSNTEASRKLAKYVVEIGACNITFIPRNAVKGQVLADFLLEFPKGDITESYFRMPEAPVVSNTLYALRLTFSSTNNEAKYKALLAGLRIARRMNISSIDAKVDSKLVASQINESYVSNKDNIMKYLSKAKEYISSFKSFSIENIPRNMNQKADVLSKLASVAFNHLTKEGLVEVLSKRSTECQEVNTVVEEEEDNWMTPIIRCLEEGPLQANYVIREIHMGSYEAKPLVRITGKEVIRFVMDNIISKFGLPRIIVMKNEAQLVNDLFKNWCERLQSNKAMETPFSLTYGSEPVILAEIGIPTYRTMMVTEGYTEEEMRLNLNLLQERRETATIREARYKTKMEQNEASKVEDQGKLGPKWEGPYKVTKAYENDSYKLQTLEDEERLQEVLKKRGKFVRQPRNDKKTFQRSCDDKNGKSAAIRIVLLENIQKSPKDKNQRAFVRGSWSDSGEEDDEKVENETCLVAQASSEICLGVDLEPDEWIKDSGCSKHMTGNRKLFSSYKAYNGGYSQNSKAYIILNKHTRKFKEQLNVTFDETPPPSKTSPLVDDDLDKEEAIKEIMPRKSSEDHKNTRHYIPIISHEYRTPIKEKLRNLESRCIHEGRVVFENFADLNYVRSLFSFVEFECLLEINDQICPRFILEFYSQYQLNYSDEGQMFIEFVIQNQFFSYSLEEFAQILDIPCEGACVFTNKWSLDELAYGVSTDGPYQTNPPSPDDIISSFELTEKVKSVASVMRKKLMFLNIKFSFVKLFQP